MQIYDAGVKFLPVWKKGEILQINPYYSGKVVDATTRTYRARCSLASHAALPSSFSLPSTQSYSTSLSTPALYSLSFCLFPPTLIRTQISALTLSLWFHLIFFLRPRIALVQPTSQVTDKNHLALKRAECR